MSWLANVMKSNRVNEDSPLTELSRILHLDLRSEAGEHGRVGTETCGMKHQLPEDPMHDGPLRTPEIRVEVPGVQGDG